MTREEAIQILRDTPIDIRSTREDDIHTLYATAQNMAIEALSQPIVAKHFDIQSGYIYCSPQIAENVEVVVRCKDCRYQVHCYQTVSHNKIHDGFREYWSEPIEFCSRGERREDE